MKKGSYAEWFSINPQLLEPVLSLIFTGAENPPLATPATIALKDITRECKFAITPYSEQIARKIAVIIRSFFFFFLSVQLSLL